MLLGLFLPRQEEFFTLFEAIAQCATKSAESLYQEIQQLPSPAVPAEQILQYKKEAKGHAQRLFTVLHKTFITPFDRYDIHRLNDKLYDIVNTINLTAKRFPAYKIQQVPQAMITLAEICHHSTELVQQIISHLRNLRHHPEISHRCNQVKSYESQADQILIDGIACLIEEENDCKMIFKLKEIYGLMESITDRCQEVAFIVEGIVLEHA